jgi:hypothetical protein
VVFTVSGDTFLPAAQIAALLWMGTTTAGDRVILKHRMGHELLWEAITDTTSTYLGAALPQAGMSAPSGFYVERLDSGKLLIYLAEK